MKPAKHILPIIVVSQFCCTSLWFAGNGVMEDLSRVFELQASALGHLTSAVQFGFIVGTLVFALFTIADRFSPSKVFFVSAILGSGFNLMTIFDYNTLYSLLALRFFTGFFLAGIYPVGMKIAADYYDKGLGRSLGYLVGALVVGTAFPHLLKGGIIEMPWKHVLIFTSSIAFLGGLLMFLLVSDGPYRKARSTIDLSAFFKVFKDLKFRSAAFGYFGHMWELYAFWAFVPVILSMNINQSQDQSFNISFWSFIIIGLGGLSCVIGGYISEKKGTKKTAFIALLFSCFCCLFSPIIFYTSNSFLFLGFLIFWGLMVIADSPLFSTLVAQNALSENKGTALTIVNCIGFAITIVSIQLLTFLIEFYDTRFIFMVLSLGPILGLLALRTKRKYPK
jgi:MFS family permease